MRTSRALNFVILLGVVSLFASPARRATAYGVFNLVYGVAWFGGSALMGWLYSRRWAR